MNYSGHIIGIQPKNSTCIYTIDSSDGAIIWHIRIFEKVEEANIQFEYLYKGDVYKIALMKVKDGYYAGKLFYAQKQCGECFLNLYKKGNSLLLKGDYKDDWSGSWEVFVELNEIVAT